MIFASKNQNNTFTMKKLSEKNFTFFLCIMMKSNQRYDNFAERATFLRKTINDLKVKKKKHTRLKNNTISNFT